MSAGHLDAAVNADKSTGRITELIDQLEDRRSLTARNGQNLSAGAINRQRNTSLREQGKPASAITDMTSTYAA